MLQGHFVLIQIVSNIIPCLSIYPGSAEQAGTLALLLTHNLPAVHAVVHELVPRTLAVAELSPRNQELRNVFDLPLLWFHLFPIFPTFYLLLLIFYLLLISSIGFWMKS